MIALKEHPCHTRSSQRPPTREESPGRAGRPFSPEAGTQLDGKIKNILVPTDLSAGSAEAIARAGELARRHNATLTILHVIDINSPRAWTHSGTAEALMNALWTEGVSELRRLVESLSENLPDVRSCIAEGLPAEEIVHHSRDFDLVVLGEDRRKGVWSWFSKNTARQVVEKAECPIMMVHPRDVQESNSVMYVVPEASTARGSQLSSPRPQS